jgi:hypothetical protein
VPNLNFAKVQFLAQSYIAGDRQNQNSLFCKYKGNPDFIVKVLHRLLKQPTSKFRPAVMIALYQKRPPKGKKNQLLSNLTLLQQSTYILPANKIFRPPEPPPARVRAGRG